MAQGTAITELTPDRWSMLQRQAQAFASSDLVPVEMQKNIGNCTVALLLAYEMGESPLQVMRSVYFVNGRPGWAAQYMVARANTSGKLRGPLRWRTTGEGENLAVTCYARLREAPEQDPPEEVTISLKMAKADGWTRNAKYTSIPEQMLVWRSATWFIRRYIPECMYGLPTVDELEDTIKDVTPAPPRLDDYAPKGTRRARAQHPDPAPQSDDPPPSPASFAIEQEKKYDVTYLDGTIETFTDPAEAAQSLRGLLTEASRIGQKTFDETWKNNARGAAALREAGILGKWHPQLSDEPRTSEDLAAGMEAPEAEQAIPDAPGAPARDPWWDTQDLRLWNIEPPVTAKGNLDYKAITAIILGRVMECPTVANLHRLRSTHNRVLNSIKISYPDGLKQINDASEAKVAELTNER